jgi:hypothetical protein
MMAAKMYGIDDSSVARTPTARVPAVAVAARVVPLIRLATMRGIQA